MHTFGRRRAAFGDRAPLTAEAAISSPAALAGHRDHVPPPVAHDAAAEIPPPIPPATPRPLASDSFVFHVIRNRRGPPSRTCKPCALRRWSGGDSQRNTAGPCGPAAPWQTRHVSLRAGGHLEFD